jgi:hypothetical protein
VFQLKTAIIVLTIAAALLMGVSCIATGRAEARADISDYLYSAPNSWEPVGYNVNGTAAHQVVDRLGWNKIKIIGNVGIGNGSMQAFNDSTAAAGNYTDSYLMGADISTAPLDKSRYGSAVSTDTGSGATDNSSTSNSSTPNSSTPAVTGKQRVNRMGQFNNGSISFSQPVNDAYHPIHAGNPVNDMQYQNPGSPIICDCAMLRGLQMPGGANSNICIRCLGYGY